MFLSFLSISPSVDLQIDQMMEQDKQFTRFLPVTLETQFRWEQQTKAIYDKNRKTKHQIKCAHFKFTQIIVILSQLDSFSLIAIWFFFLCTKFLRFYTQQNAFDPKYFRFFFTCEIQFEEALKLVVLVVRAEIHHMMVGFCLFLWIAQTMNTNRISIGQ